MSRKVEKEEKESATLKLEPKKQILNFDETNEIKNLYKSFKMVQLGLTTLKTSLLALQSSWRGKLTREKVNEYLIQWAQSAFNKLKAKCEVYNENQFHFQEKKPYILMSNHISNFDIPAIFLGLKGSIRMIAKKELFKVPIWGKAMSKSEFLSVDRTNQRQAHKDLSIAREKMMSGIHLWISPEGQIALPNQGLLPFKSGGFRIALDTGATILPIGIRGTSQINTPISRKFFKEQIASIHIGNPIDLTENSFTLKSLMDQVREQLISLGDYKY